MKYFEYKVKQAEILDECFDSVRLSDRQDAARRLDELMLEVLDTTSEIYLTKDDGDGQDIVAPRNKLRSELRGATTGT